MTEYIDACGHAIEEGQDWWVSKGTPRECEPGTTVTLGGSLHTGFFGMFYPDDLELAFEEGGEMIPLGMQMNEDNTDIQRIIVKEGKQ